MSAFHGKFIIGLTGNIATGKSVVRHMLEHLGAYGIDADQLSNRAIAKGAPGYEAVVETFGKWLLAPDGQVDRGKLGKLVFANPDALSKLEAIVHPLVRKASMRLIENAPHEVVVLEAIKLLESPLREYVDSVWVTTAPEEKQIARLQRARDMDEQSARARINAQSTQEEKIAAADVVIDNDGSFEAAWKQVSAAWMQLFPSKPSSDEEVRAAKVALPSDSPAEQQELLVVRAGPDRAGEIAQFITRQSNGTREVRREDIMAAFGEKAFLLLLTDERLVGLVGWQVENLVARVDEFYLDARLSLAAAMLYLISEVEAASRQLQAEAALIFVPPALAKEIEVWTGLGYEVRTPETLDVNVWREAAQAVDARGEVMLFKQLRTDRVLRPL